MMSQTQPAVQPPEKGRPFGSWQKSEAFVVAIIPCRTFWFGQPAGERRDATCSAARRRNEELVTAHWATSANKSSGVAIPRRQCGLSLWPHCKEFGKPDAGKPPVRFDEGREADGHWLRPLNPSLPAYSTHCRGRCVARTACRSMRGARAASSLTSKYK